MDTQTFVARPDDAEVKRYLDNDLGQQRTILDEYVKRAASAGIKRGGMNVAGSAPLDSSLRAGEISALAAGASQAFRDAMDYGKYVKSTRYKQFQDRLNYRRQMDNDLNSRLAAALKSSSVTSTANKSVTSFNATAAGQPQFQQSAGFLTLGQSNRPEPVSGAKSGTSAAADDSAVMQSLKARESELKQKQMELDLETAKHKAQMDDWRNYTEKQQNQERLNDQAKWNQLTAKAGLTSTLGKQGAGWTAQDDMLMDYLGVKMGYLKPWARSAAKKTL